MVSVPRLGPINDAPVDTDTSRSIVAAAMIGDRGSADSLPSPMSLCIRVFQVSSSSSVAASRPILMTPKRGDHVFCNLQIYLAYTLYSGTRY